MPDMDAGSIATIVISVVAVAIAVQQGITARKHNKLSVTPLLSYDFNVFADSIEPYIELLVRNNGVGPAIIISQMVFIDGDSSRIETVYSFNESIYSSCASVISARSLWFSKNDSLGVDEGKILLLVKCAKTNDPDKATLEIVEFLSRIRVEIRYKSVYGNKYIAKICPSNENLGKR